MTVHNVKVLAGFRLLFTAEQWEEFCVKLQEHVNGDGCDECSDSESCSGSDSDSGSDSGSDSDSSESSIDPDEAIANFEDNFDVFFKELFADYPYDVTYNATPCYHNKEGMDRTIDIGFDVGDFSVSGDHEGSHCSLSHASQSIKEASKKSFAKKIQDTFMGEYCLNTEAELYGQTDGCVFCH